MSSSLITTIADDIVATLNAATNANAFSKSIQATRFYQPINELESLVTTPAVSVVPSSIAGQRYDRGAFTFDDVIDIGVQGGTTGTLTDLDAWMYYVQQLADYLRRNALLGNTALYISDKSDPAFAPEHLQEFGLFTSVLSMTYRAVY